MIQESLLKYSKIFSELPNIPESILLSSETSEMINFPKLKEFLNEKPLWLPDVLANVMR